MKSLRIQIKTKITRSGRGSVFTPKDFLQYGSRAAVDKVLQRLVASGNIRRLARGIYDYPNSYPSLGMLAPDPDLLAVAVARQTGEHIFTSGVKSANLLGLSTQVPAKLTYYTSGTSKDKIVGNYTLHFKHTPIHGLDKLNKVVAYVVHALLYLGKKNIDHKITDHLRLRIPHSDRKHLLRVLNLVPGWLTPALKEIAK